MSESTNPINDRREPTAPERERAAAPPDSRGRERGRFGRWFNRFLVVLGASTLAFILLLVLLPLLFFRGPALPREVILELDVEDGLVESTPTDPVGAILGIDQLTLRDAVEALDRGGEDDRVKALIARISGGSLSMAQAEELREAVTRFRASGKPAIAFATTFGEAGSGNAGYYLASAFDEVWLQPSGDVGLTGLRAEIPFIAGTFEQIGVEPRMGARYEYKDAVNMFTETEMTAPQREATERVLTSMYENLVAGVAAGRGMPVEEARRLVDTGPHLGDEALAAGLVDRLAYRDEVFDSLRARVGGGEYLYVDSYLDAAGRPNASGPEIALIYGTGAVQIGDSEVNPFAGGTVMGSESVTRAFHEAIEADGVRAILFRVDSPGGSYVASDAIWRATIRAREAGKPVIVSMGSVAGSGGYFVAMGADRIVAQPSTITGSIGVYGGKMLIGGLSEHLGVTWDGVGVGGNTTMWSLVEDYTPEERTKLEASLDRIYADFTGKVAEGREIAPDSVDAIARGRIWTGADALRLGLVDELGGMDVALRLAREAAGIDPDAEVRLREYPRAGTIIQQLLASETTSYPTALAAVARLGRLVETIAAELHAVGLTGPREALRMPSIPAIR